MFGNIIHYIYLALFAMEYSSAIIMEMKVDYLNTAQNAHNRVHRGTGVLANYSESIMVTFNLKSNIFTTYV